MSADDRESELARLLRGGMIGAVSGAVIGLVVFGGIILVPALTMIAGAVIGVWYVSRGVETAPGADRHADRPSPARRVMTGPVRLPSPAYGDQPPIDLNTADADELTCLPGVGRAAAARIVAHRERHGLFRSLGDLEAVEGFDHGRIARLAPRATLSSPEEAGEPVSA